MNIIKIEELSKLFTQIEMGEIVEIKYKDIDCPISNFIVLFNCSPIEYFRFDQQTVFPKYEGNPQTEEEALDIINKTESSYFSGIRAQIDALKGYLNVYSYPYIKRIMSE